MGYSEQAESIRYTCSRDPAHCNQNVKSVDKFVFSKNKTDKKNKEKEETHVKWQYVQGVP